MFEEIAVTAEELSEAQMEAIAEFSLELAADEFDEYDGLI